MSTSKEPKAPSAKELKLKDKQSKTAGASSASSTEAAIKKMVFEGSPPHPGESVPHATTSSSTSAPTEKHAPATRSTQSLLGASSSLGSGFSSGLGSSGGSLGLSSRASAAGSGSGGKMLSVSTGPGGLGSGVLGSGGLGGGAAVPPQAAGKTSTTGPGGASIAGAPAVDARKSKRSAGSRRRV
jgi:hypothetical protein